jgi:hypothetical protein
MNINKLYPILIMFFFSTCSCMEEMAAGFILVDPITQQPESTISRNDEAINKEKIALFEAAKSDRLLPFMNHFALLCKTTWENLRKSNFQIATQNLEAIHQQLILIEQHHASTSFFNLLVKAEREWLKLLNAEEIKIFYLDIHQKMVRAPVSQAIINDSLKQYHLNKNARHLFVPYINRHAITPTEAEAFFYAATCFSKILKLYSFFLEYGLLKEHYLRIVKNFDLTTGIFAEICYKNYTLCTEANALFNQRFNGR